MCRGPNQSEASRRESAKECLILVAVEQRPGFARIRDVEPDDPSPVRIAVHGFGVVPDVVVYLGYLSAQWRKQLRHRLDRFDRSELLPRGDLRANVRHFVQKIRDKFARIDPAFDAIETYQGFGYRWRSTEAQPAGGAVGGAPAE